MEVLGHIAMWWWWYVLVLVPIALLTRYWGYWGPSPEPYPMPPPVLGFEVEVPNVPISLTQEQAESIIGRKLPAELFQFVPLGHNLVVVREKPKTMHGKLHIPARSQSARAVGWVVAVGPDVGTGIVNWISRWPWPREQLLGTKVVFGAYAGIALLMDNDSTLEEWVEEAGGAVSVNDDYLSPFKLMTDNSFLGILRDTPTPHTWQSSVEGQPVTYTCSVTNEEVPSPVEVWASSVQTSEKEREEWQQSASGPAPSLESAVDVASGSASTEASGTEPAPSANRFDN